MCSKFGVYNFVYFLLLSLLLSCGGGSDNGNGAVEKIIITGIVQNAEGQPLVGAEVIIEGVDLQVKTDENGQFSFEIAAGFYSFEITFDTKRIYHGDFTAKAHENLALGNIRTFYIATINFFDESIDFTPGTLIQSKSEFIGAQSGGSIQVNEATLVITPGSLDANTEISLFEVSIPSKNVTTEDGAMAGQILLTESAYVVGTDRDVVITSPVKLTFKLNPSRLPEQLNPENLHLSTLIGGMIIPQGNPSSYDATTASVFISVDPIKLQKNFNHQLIYNPPLGAGIPFAFILDKILLVGTGAAIVSSVWNPILVTIDDSFSPFIFDTYNSDHFNVTYRGDHVTLERVFVIADALESAYQLFVTQMKFELPNLVNLDSQYTVFIDDFRNHKYLGLTGGTDADGFTLPGSSLFEGASYVNNRKPPTNWPSTAVHEYFHALQFGVISTFVPNLFHRTFYLESSWLFEGSATALSGRVVGGDRIKPARDSTLGLHLIQGKSLYDAEQIPAPDVAQDFFYFLEKSFDHIDFYLDMFESLTEKGSSNIPSSITAADEVIRSSDPTGEDHIGIAWSEFVKDISIDHPAEYGGNIMAASIETLNDDGVEKKFSRNMAPLSYHIVDYNVTPFKKDVPIPIQPQDVALNISLKATEFMTADVFVDLVKDGKRPEDYPKKILLTDISEIKQELIGFRTDRQNKIRVVIANWYKSPDKAFDVSVTGQLRGFEETGYHVAYQYFDSEKLSSGTSVLNLVTGNHWNVGPGISIALSASGTLLHFDNTDGSNKLYTHTNWGKNAGFNFHQTDCAEGFTNNEEDITISNNGRIYLAGEYQYVELQDDGTQVKRTNQGIVSCLEDGSGFVPVKIDLNNDFKIDFNDSFTPNELKIAQTERTLVFGIHKEARLWLASVDTSGVGLQFLTANYSEDLLISDNGSQATFQLDQDHDFRIGTSPTARGAVIDLDQSSGFELQTNGAGISPNGQLIASVYSQEISATEGDTGIIFIDSTSATVARKISTADRLIPDSDPPQFTPDGQNIIFVGIAIKDKKPAKYADLYIMKIDGSGLRNITQTEKIHENRPLIR